LKLAFKPIGRAWGDDAVKIIRSRTPRRTGATAASIRVRNNTQTRTTVAAKYTFAFINSDVKAHDIFPRKASRLVFQADGRTIFARKVHKPRTQGLQIAPKGAREALDRNPAASELIDQWNRAA
jgi:hypothetical protein